METSCPAPDYRRGWSPEGPGEDPAVAGATWGYLIPMEILPIFSSFSGTRGFISRNVLCGYRGSSLSQRRADHRLKGKARGRAERRAWIYSCPSHWAGRPEGNIPDVGQRLLMHSDQSAGVNRRDFLRKAAVTGGIVWSVPLIVTLDASPAYATPAPSGQIVRTASVLVDEDDVVDTFATPTLPGCASATLRVGGRWGFTHIQSPSPLPPPNGRDKHPWNQKDIDATRHCLQHSSPVAALSTSAKAVYECCDLPSSLKYECPPGYPSQISCRRVVVNKETCNIITSFDTCDGALN